MLTSAHAMPFIPTSQLHAPGTKSSLTGGHAGKGEGRGILRRRSATAFRRLARSSCPPAPPGSPRHGQAHIHPPTHPPIMLLNWQEAFAGYQHTPTHSPTRPHAPMTQPAHGRCPSTRTGTRPPRSGSQPAVGGGPPPGLPGGGTARAWQEGGQALILTTPPWSRTCVAPGSSILCSPLAALLRPPDAHARRPRAAEERPGGARAGQAVLFRQLDQLPLAAARPGRAGGPRGEGRWWVGPTGEGRRGTWGSGGEWGACGG